MKIQILNLLINNICLNQLSYVQVGVFLLFIKLCSESWMSRFAFFFPFCKETNKFLV